MKFAIHQNNDLQGWAPVHFAALFVLTGLVLTPTPDSFYASGPVIITQNDLLLEESDELRICTDDAFPVCPNINGPHGLPLECPCTVRKTIVIGGVIHGSSGVEMWDTIYAAAQQGASDMGITLRFDLFEQHWQQQIDEIFYENMKSKILHLCENESVDGLFVSIPSDIIVDAIKRCTELGIPVISINSGFEMSKELNLLHYVGMVGLDACYQAGKKMTQIATINKAVCLNPVPGLAILDNRCTGFGKAMSEYGIEYLGMVEAPNFDISAETISSIELEVGQSGDWDGYGFFVSGYGSLPAALELKKTHPQFVMSAFDTSNLLYEALDNGDALFGIDTQAYLRGYLPVLILTHEITSGQHFLDHALNTGPRFVFSSPSSQMADCKATHFCGNSSNDCHSVSAASRQECRLGAFKEYFLDSLEYDS